MMMRIIPVMWTDEGTTGTNEHSTAADGGADVSDLLDLREIGLWMLRGEVTGGAGHDGVATTLDFQLRDEAGLVMVDEINCGLGNESLATAAGTVSRFRIAPKFGAVSVNASGFLRALRYMKIAVQSGDADKAITVKMWLEGIVLT